MDKEDVVQIYNAMLLSHKTEQNNAIRSNTDRLGYCHTKWSKREKEMHLISLICGILKNGINELIYKQKESHNVENNLMVPGEEGRDELWHWDWRIHTNIYVCVYIYKV